MARIRDSFPAESLFPLTRANTELTISAPLISVCIPARNEEKLIGECLSSIRAAEKQLGAPVEIVVCLNRCTDRTEEIALAHGAKIVREDAKNLSKIRNAAARAATGRILVTIDADSRMTPNMLVEVRKRIDTGRVVGGGVQIRLERYSVGIVLSMVMVGVVAVFSGVSGGMFWLLREDFFAVGGFDEEVLIGEDVAFAFRIKKFGKRTGRKFREIRNAHIVTSCRKFDKFGDWYLLNPVELWKLAHVRDQTVADRTWYEVER